MVDTEPVACIIASIGAILHFMVVFGHDLASVAGPSGGAVLATIFAMSGGYAMLDKVGLFDN